MTTDDEARQDDAVQTTTTTPSSPTSVPLAVVLAAVGAVGLWSALWAITFGALDVAFSGEGDAVDVCGVPLTGIDLMWFRLSGGLLVALGLALVAAVGGIVVWSTRGRRPAVAAALVATVVVLSPVPWMVAEQRDEAATVCGPY